MDLDGSFLWIITWFALLAFWGYKGWLRHKEREMDLRAMGRLPQIANRQSNVELRRISEELNRLRETSTQYDLTVERELTELRERVVFLEGKLRELQPRPSSNTFNTPGGGYTQSRNMLRAETEHDAATVSVH